MVVSLQTSFKNTCWRSPISPHFLDFYGIYMVMYEYHHVNPWISWNPMDFYVNQLKNTDGTEHEIGWEWVQKPDIRSRPKNGSRAMKMSRSGNGFGPGPRNALKQLSAGSKNQTFGLNQKMDRAQWKWAVLAIVLSQELEIVQNGFLEAPKTRYAVQSRKWVARNENEPFWQWFWASIQKCFKIVF